MPYQEPGKSQVTHEGRKYDLNAVLRMADQQTQMRNVDELAQLLENAKVDPERVDKVDITAPLLVTKDRKGQDAVLDGMHRLAKAKQLGLTKVPVNEVNILREGEPWKIKGHNNPMWERGREQPAPKAQPEPKTRGVLKRLLAQAAKNREYMAIRYQKDHGGEVKDYLVAPYALKKIRAARTGQEQNVLAGWDRAERKIKNFYLANMLGVAPTNSKYEPIWDEEGNEVIKQSETNGSALMGLIKEANRLRRVIRTAPESEVRNMFKKYAPSDLVEAYARRTEAPTRQEIYNALTKPRGTTESEDVGNALSAMGLGLPGTNPGKVSMRELQSFFNQVSKARSDATLDQKGLWSRAFADKTPTNRYLASKVRAVTQGIRPSEAGGQLTAEYSRTAGRELSPVSTDIRNRPRMQARPIVGAQPVNLPYQPQSVVYKGVGVSRVTPPAHTAQRRTIAAGTADPVPGARDRGVELPNPVGEFVTPYPSTAAEYAHGKGLVSSYKVPGLKFIAASKPGVPVYTPHIGSVDPREIASRVGTNKGTLRVDARDDRTDYEGVVESLPKPTATYAPTASGLFVPAKWQANPEGAMNYIKQDQQWQKPVSMHEQSYPIIPFKQTAPAVQRGLNKQSNKQALLTLIEKASKKDEEKCKHTPNPDAPVVDPDCSTRGSYFGVGGINPETSKDSEPSGEGTDAGGDTAGSE